MHHGFDIDLAVKYGVLPAIMLEYIAHWVIYNRSLNQNQVNGKFWTYNTVAGMKEQFPYMSTEQIRYSIRKLKSANLILIDKLSTDKHNNTNWYSLSAEGERVCGNYFKKASTDFPNSDCEKAYMHFPNSDCENSQADCENSQSLRTCNHYNITNNITNNTPLPPVEKKETILSIIESYTADQKIIELLKEFCDLRIKRKKPLTTRAMKMALSKLNDLAGSDADLKQKIIEQTIFHCWDTFYAIKDDNRFSGNGNKHPTMAEQVKATEERLRQKGIEF